MNIITLPNFLFKTEDWSDSDGACFYKKTFTHPQALGFKCEVDFYLKKYKKIYSITKSNSGLSFVLKINDGSFYWEDCGWFVRRLKGSNIEEDLHDAIKHLPNEAAFFCHDTIEYISGDSEFDSWFEKKNLFKK